MLGVFADPTAAKRAYSDYDECYEGDWYSPDPSIWRLKTQSGPRGYEAARIEEHEVQE